MGLVNIYITYNILMSKEIRDINCYHEDEFIEFINEYFELHYIESDGTRYRYHLIDSDIDIKLEIRTGRVTDITLVTWSGGWTHKQKCLNLEYDLFNNNWYKNDNDYTKDMMLYKENIKKEEIYPSFLKFLKDNCSLKELRDIKLKQLKIN